MVAIFTGLGAGFERGSGSILGGAGLLGSGSLGRNKEQVLLNAATGNLLISQQDEFLVGLGPDSTIGRTYNSIESVSDGDNGDHWRQSTTRAVHGLTGTLNTAGSTIKRTSGDGSDITYTYQTINGVSAYFATDGSGAYDKLVNASGVWTWTDGDTQFTETYAAYGADNWRITEAANTIGLKLTFAYTGANLTQVTTQDGSYEQYSWSGSNITQVTTGYTDLVTSTAKTLTRTRYGYDTSNRLTAVTIDLSPGDNSIADGKVYTTSYTYIGATKMVATITETDGSSLTIGYDGSNRVHTLTQAVAGTTTRVTTIDYYSGYSTVTDATGQVTRLDYDASDNLTKITAPAASTGLASQVTKFTYDANGNVTSVTDPLGNMTAYSNFTAWGHAQTITDPLGNVTARTYGSKNELLTETVTGDDQSGTAQSHTTRYVYDASNRLAFEVSPDGNVVEHRYAQTGEWLALTYVGQVYDTSGLSSSTISTNLKPDLTNASQWTKGNVTMAAAGTIGGEPATQFTTQTTGTGASIGSAFTVAAGDTLTWEVAIKGSGTTLQDVLGFYGSATGWGDTINTTATVLSGPGSFTGQYNSLWVIGNLSTATETRVRITRTFTQAETVYGFFYVRTSGGDATAGDSVILASPNIVKTTTGQAPTLAQMNAWVAGLSDPTAVNQTYTQYDARGNVTGVYGYAASTNPGTGSTANGYSFTSYVYDQAGQLLSRKDDQHNAETYVYDGLGRVVASVDLQGSTTSVLFDDTNGRTIVTLANGLTQTSTYNKAGDLISYTQSTASISANLKPDLTNASQWTKGNVTMAAAGTIGGEPATQFTTQTTGTAASIGSGPFTVAAGDTLTWEVAIKGSGTTLQDVLGFYGSASGWGDTINTTATVLSGPGSFTGQYNSLWVIGNLSTTTETRIRITRTFTQAETVYGLFYVRTSGGDATAGDSVILASPNIVKTTASTIGTNLKPDLTNASQWTKGNVTMATAGTIGGEPATQFTTQTTGTAASIGSGPFTVAAGDTLTWEVAIKGSGKTLQDVLGFYGSATGWGDTINTTATVLSGPGSFTGQYNSLWVIGNLSTTTETRIRITRTFTQAETVYGLFYVRTSGGDATAGDSVILASPNIVKTTAADALVTVATSTYGYDQLGRLRMVTDATQHNSYMIYDNAGRKVGDVDHYGVLTEYKYDADNRVVATVRYATALTSTQLATLQTLTVAFDLATNRPAGSASDLWTFNVYDKDGRTIQTVDGAGDATAYSYDASGKLTGTTAYFNKLTATQIANLKAAVSVINLEPDLSNTNQWGLSGLTRTGTGPYTFTATGTAGNLWAGNFTVAAGDTLVWDVTVRGAGSTLTDALGFYSETGWGDSSTVTASILSGPGSITVNTSAPVTLTGLQTNADTRIRITRTFATAATASAFFYVKGCNTATAGDAVTLSAPSIAYLPRYTSASEALNRISNSQFDGTTGWMTGYDPQNIVNSGSPYTGTSGGHSYIKTGFTATGSGQVASISTGASDWFKVVPGERLSASAGFEGIGPISSLRFVFNWRDANGNALPTTTIGQISGTATFNSKLSGFATVPVGAVDARLEVYMTSSAAGTGSFSMIEPMVSTASAAQTDQPPFLPTPIFDPVHDKTSRIFYDKTGRVVGTLDGEGYLSTATYDAGGFKIAETAYASQVASGDRASASLVTIQSHLGTNSANRTTHYVYDNEGLLTFVVDAQNHVTEYAYPGQSLGDVIGRPTKTIQYAGTVSSPNAWTVAGVRAAINAVSGLASNSGNRISQAVYDAHENLSYAIDPAGGFTAFAYDNMGHVTRTVRYATLWDGSTPATFASSHMSDADNRTTRSYYDARGDLTFTIDGVGYVTRYDYDAEDRQVGSVRWDNPISLASVTDATLVTDIPALVSGIYTATATSYDMDGRVASMTDGEGVVTSYVYNANGTLNTRIDAYGTSDAVQTYYVYDTAGRVVSRYDAYGATEQTITSFTYDGLGNVVTVTDPLGNITYSYYDRLGRVVSTRDAENYVTETTYNAFNEAVSVTRRSNRATNTASVSTLPVYTADSAHDATSYSYYNILGQVTATRDAEDYVTEYSYTNFGEISSTTRRANKATNSASATALPTYTADSARDIVSYSYYDMLGRLATTRDAESYVAEFAYNAFGNTVSVTRRANKATNTASVSTLPTYTADAVNDATSFSYYNRRGQVTTSRDAENYVTETAYNAAGDAVSITRRANKATNTASATTLPVYTADAVNDATSYAYYNRRGQATTTRDAEGYVTETGYNARGEVVSSTRRANKASNGASALVLPTYTADTARDQTSYLYRDHLGRVTMTRDAEGYVVETAYNAAGAVVSVMRRANAATNTASATIVPTYTADAAKDAASYSYYDKLGRLTTMRDAENDVTEMAYDTLGNIVSITQRANKATNTASASTLPVYTADTAKDATSYSYYDRLGRLTTSRDAESYVTETAYDSAGNTVSVMRRANKATNSASAAALPVYTADSVNDAASYRYYDRRNLLTASRDAENDVTEMAYDARGNTVSVTRRFNKATNTASVTTLPTYTADTAKDATSYNYYDRRDLLTTSRDAESFVTEMAYNAFGEMVSVTRRANAATNTASATTLPTYTADTARDSSRYNYYDRLGRLVLQVDAEKYATATSYTFTGKIDTVTRYAAHVTWTGTPGPANLPAVHPDSTKDSKSSFIYDKLDRVKSTSQATDSNTANNITESYNYNAFGDRESVTNKLGGLTTNSFDKRGLLTSEVIQVTAAGATVTNTYDYDTRGNRIKMVEAFGAAEARTTLYDYDKLDRLNKTTGDAVTIVNDDLTDTAGFVPITRIIYDGRGNAIEQIDPAGARTLAWYDKLGHALWQLVQTDKPSGVEKGVLTRNTYDANGNVTSAKIYGDLVTLPADATGSAPAPVDANNYRLTGFTYDRNDRLSKTTVSGVATGEWNGSSYVTSSTDITVSQDYDAAGNVIRQGDARGNSLYTWYDMRGRKVAQVDAENYLTTWLLDAEGNVSSETRYANKVTGAFTTATAASALPGLLGTGATDANRTTLFLYDLAGRRIEEKRLAVAYTAISAAGVATDVAATDSTAVSKVNYTYNALGQVLSKTEATGERTDYTYDVVGRLTLETDQSFKDYLWTTGNDNAAPRTSYVYDGLNNLKSSRVQVDASGTNSNDHVTGYTYGAGGRLATMTDAQGFTHNYGYDAAGRVVRDSYTRLKSDGTTSVTEAQVTRYDLRGRATTQTMARLSGSTWVFTSELVGAPSYEAVRIRYNAFGEVTGRGTTVSAAATAVYQETFDYDAGGRLWRSNTGDGALKFFIYDKAGNSTLTLTSTGADLSALTLSNYAASIDTTGDTSTANATTSITVYDKRGLQTGKIAPDRILAVGAASVTITSTRAYNAFGEMASSTDERNYTTSFIYNTMGRVLSKISPQVSVTSSTGVVSNVNPTEIYGYDLSGRLVSTSNANGYRTTRMLLAGTGFDGQDPLIAREFHADGGVFETRYDVFGNARILRNELYNGTNATNTDQVQTFDKMGRLTDVQHRGNLLTDHYNYDGLGERIKHWITETGSTITGIGAYVDTTDYDSRGRIIKTVAAGGDVTGYAYSWDSALITSGLGTFGGWVKTITFANTRQTTESTDYFSHTAARTDMSPTATNLTYDKGGRLTATATGGDSTSYTWLNSGLIGTVTAVVGGITTIQTSTYDAANNKLTEYQTRAGAVIENATVSYDALNHMVNWAEAGGGIAIQANVAYAYDTAGNVRRANSTFSLYRDEWFAYDSMNRVVIDRGALVGGQIVRANDNGLQMAGTGAGAGTYYDYDLAGNRKTAIHTERTLVDSVDIGDGNGHVKNTYRDLNVTETYGYNADGRLTSVYVATDTYNLTTKVVEAGVAQLRASYTNDALGRVARQIDWIGNGTNAGYDRQAFYNSAGQVTSEVVSSKQGTDTIASTTTNNYGATGTTGYALGSITYSETASATNGGSAVTSSTTNNYAWISGPMISSTYYKPNKNQSTTYISTYTLSALGQVSSVVITDGRPRTVTFTNDVTGLVLRREEADNDPNLPNPLDVWYRFAGREMGHVSNNGTLETDYSSSIDSRMAPVSTGNFANGSNFPTAYSDFSQGLSPINSYSQGGGSGTYTVQSGDTLAGIAAATWGDANLWYKLAEANGLGANATLVAGTRLTIPSNIIRNTHSASTFNPYDPAQTLGQNSPTAPKPAKDNGCGVIGQILMLVVAIAITAIIKVPVTHFIAGIFAGPTAVVAATAAGTAVALTGVTAVAAGVVAGAVIGAAASIGSQLFGMAIDAQHGFNWKAVAIGAIAGGVGGGLNTPLSKTGGSIFSKIGLGGTGWAAQAARAGISAGVSGGIDAGLGLAKFDFAGVAAAAVGAGVSSQIGSLGIIGENVALGLTEAATRSVLTGTDFGDNILAVLPNVIGNTIGGFIGEGIAGRGRAPLTPDSKAIKGKSADEVRAIVVGRMLDSAGSGGGSQAREDLEALIEGGDPGVNGVIDVATSGLVLGRDRGISIDDPGGLLAMSSSRRAPPVMDASNLDINLVDHRTWGDDVATAALGFQQRFNTVYTPEARTAVQYGMAALKGGPVGVAITYAVNQGIEAVASNPSVRAVLERATTFVGTSILSATSSKSQSNEAESRRAESDSGLIIEFGVNMFGITALAKYLPKGLNSIPKGRTGSRLIYDEPIGPRLPAAERPILSISGTGKASVDTRPPLTPNSVKVTFGNAAKGAGAKRGPKTDPNAPHNARIRAEAAKLEADGYDILAGGGGRERLIPTPGGKKSGRRPDILYGKPNESPKARNVGRTKADGTPVTREQDALNDLIKKGGIETDFVGYDD